MPKRNVGFVTPRDLNLKVEYEGLPIAVIIEGKIQYKNLKLIGKMKNG